MINNYEIQPLIHYKFKDFNGNYWCDSWVDSYNNFTLKINKNLSNVLSGSLRHIEREFYLDQRHKFYNQCIKICLKESVN